MTNELSAQQHLLLFTKTNNISAFIGGSRKKSAAHAPPGTLNPSTLIVAFLHGVVISRRDGGRREPLFLLSLGWGGEEIEGHHHGRRLLKFKYIRHRERGSTYGDMGALEGDFHYY